MVRDAFAELRWDIHEVACDGDLVVVHCTMSGRHVRPFAEYSPDGQVRDVFPPTGKRFAATQTHWLRVADGRVIEHWANRDDIGMAMQLGWVPPSPLYLLRSALAKRRARPNRFRPRLLLAFAVAVLAFGAVESAQAGARTNGAWGSSLRLDLGVRELGQGAGASERALARAAIERSAGRLRLSRAAVA